MVYILIGKLILDILNNTALDCFLFGLLFFFFFFLVMLNNPVSNLDRLPLVSFHVPP